MPEFRREMTVGELREALGEYPDYYPVVPVIGGTLGVLTAVRVHEVDQSPAVLIGECDLPFDLIESIRPKPDLHALSWVGFSRTKAVCRCGWRMRGTHAEIKAAHAQHVDSPPASTTTEEGR